MRAAADPPVTVRVIRTLGLALARRSRSELADSSIVERGLPHAGRTCDGRGVDPTD